MLNKKISFFTYCEDELQVRFGMHKLIASLKYFHPDLQIISYGTKEIKYVHEKFDVDFSNALPCLLLDAKIKNNLDYIIHIDSDSICFGRLDEILKFDYEIASCKNNNDEHTQDERQNRPVCLWNLPNNQYVNCGLTACGSEKFLLEWIDLNKKIKENYGKITSFWMADIQWFNYLFHYGGYNSKILDSTDKNHYYGPSLPNPKNPEEIEDLEHLIKEYGVNSWKSWKKISFNKNDNKFYYDNKQVVLLHQCGGGKVNSVIKCDFNMFNNEVKTKLQNITNIYE